MSGLLLAELPPEALAVAHWAGFGQAGVDRDVALLRSGEVDAAALLASCLRGVEDEDTAKGWRSYVKALELAAEVST